MKRTLSFTLSLLIALTAFFSIPVFARAEPGSELNFSWTLDDGELTINARGEGVVDSAPFEIFKNQIEEITIKEGITMISPSVFAGFESLENVSIPSSCEVIGNSAFAFCSRLIEVSFEEGLETIGSSAFSECTALKSLETPRGLKEIGDFAFSGCENLSDVLINPGVETIGESAFVNCGKLKKLILPDTVVSIGENSLGYFSGDLGFEKVKGFVVGGPGTESEAKRYADSNGMQFFNVFDCASENGAYSISFSASNGALKVTSTGSAKSVKVYQDVWLYYASKIKSVEFSGNIASISSVAFIDCPVLKSVKLNSGLKTIGNCAFANCPKLKSVTIPDSVTEIGSVAFGFVENKAEEQYDLLDGFTIKSGCKNAAVKTYVDELKEIEGIIVPWEKIHKFDDGKITKLPTCKEKGLKVYTCAACGAKKKETLPKGGHNYEGLVTPATLTKNGKIEVYCWVCGHVKSSGVIYKASGISLSKTSFVYNGKVRRPKVVVKDSKGKEIPSGNYTITYSNKNSKSTGIYKVTVSLSGMYNGKKVLKYRIVPAQVKNIKKTKVTSSAVSLSWSKAAGAKYYAVQYSKDGKNWSFATKATTATAFTVKGLKAGTKYSFRVKALDSAKKLSGKYSDILRAKTAG